MKNGFTPLSFAGWACVSVTLLAVATPLGAAENARAGLKEISSWELIAMGGWLMVPIALCSLMALAYALERFLNLRTGKIMPPRLVAELENVLAARNVEAAKDLCRKDESPFAQIILAGLRELGADWSRVESVIEEAGAREIAVFKQNVRPLRVVSEIAPLLGLLGTIQGMMGAFQNVSSSGGQIGKTELFAGDIFLALTTTAAGLIVAIPALFLFYYFVGRIDRIVLRMDRTSGNLLETLREVQSSAGASGSGA